MSGSVTFDASVYKIQTLVDRGIRVTLDLPETATDVAKWLMDCKREEMALRVAVVKNDGSASDE